MIRYVSVARLAWELRSTHKCIAKKRLIEGQKLNYNLNFLKLHCNRGLPHAAAFALVPLLRV